MIQVLPTDRKSLAPIVETDEGYLRNNGFTSQIIIQETQSTVLNVAIVTGNYPVLIKDFWDIGGLCTQLYYEDVTYTDSSGTEVIPINFNRVDPQDVNYVIYSGASYTTTDDTTTLIDNLSVAYGTNPGQFSADAISSNSYWILKPNTTYILSMTPSASLRMTLVMQIAEVH